MAATTRQATIKSEPKPETPHILGHEWTRTHGLLAERSIVWNLVVVVGGEHKRINNTRLENDGIIRLEHQFERNSVSFLSLGVLVRDPQPQVCSIIWFLVPILDQTLIDRHERVVETSSTLEYRRNCRLCSRTTTTGNGPGSFSRSTMDPSSCSLSLSRLYTPNYPST